MKTLLCQSICIVLGTIWWPPQATCVVRIPMTTGDIDAAREPDGSISRESLGRWLRRRTGDFSTIIDFSASIEDGGETRDIAWACDEHAHLS